MKYAKKVDANQNQIVKCLRKMGCKVHITSQVGYGFPDLVVGIADKVFLVEIKDGSKPPSQRHLTASERDFADDWGFAYVIIESLELLLVPQDVGRM